MLKFLFDLLKLSNHYSTTSRGSKSPECSWHLGGPPALCFVKNQLTLYHHIFFICILRLILRNFPKVFRIKWSRKTNAQRNVRKLLVVVRAIGFTSIGDQSKRLAHASSALPLSNRQRQVLWPCHWLLDLTSSIPNISAKDPPFNSRLRVNWKKDSISIILRLRLWKYRNFMK